ncbi:basic proline-rich protein-like [Choloepus didactylus]|uniref:basic proline-rich protein-like n=1 Tax=Choloepus didactylus TaxID=27675 RepID=UPI00189F6547|nr:basic proline-rich protein-like [Choloepus didactylus]
MCPGSHALGSQAAGLRDVALWGQEVGVCGPLPECVSRPLCLFQNPGLSLPSAAGPETSAQQPAPGPRRPEAHAPNPGRLCREAPAPLGGARPAGFSWTAGAPWEHCQAPVPPSPLCGSDEAQTPRGRALGLVQAFTTGPGSPEWPRRHRAPGPPLFRGPGHPSARASARPGQPTCRRHRCHRRRHHPEAPGGSRPASSWPRRYRCGAGSGDHGETGLGPATQGGGPPPPGAAVRAARGGHGWRRWCGAQRPARSLEPGPWRRRRRRPPDSPAGESAGGGGRAAAIDGTSRGPAAAQYGRGFRGSAGALLRAWRVAPHARTPQPAMVAERLEWRPPRPEIFLKLPTPRPPLPGSAPIPPRALKDTDRFPWPAPALGPRALLGLGRLGVRVRGPWPSRVKPRVPPQAEASIPMPVSCTSAPRRPDRASRQTPRSPSRASPGAGLGCRARAALGSSFLWAVQARGSRVPMLGTSAAGA